MRLWFFGIVSVIELDPAVFGESEYSTFEGSLLVITTAVAAGAGPHKETLTAFSKPWPTVVEGGIVQLTLTVAAKLAPVAGVVKPFGVVIATVVVPVFTPLATKLGAPVSVPPGKLMFPPVMVPMVVRLLVTGTVSVNPPRTCWMLDIAPAPVKLTELTVNAAVDPWNTLNAWPKPFGPVSTNPEFTRVIVAVVVRYPGALSVMSTVPVPTSACTKVETVFEPSAMVAVMVVLPAAVPPPTKAFAGSVEVMVNGTPPLPIGIGGVKVIRIGACRSLPMVTPGAVMTPGQLVTQDVLVKAKAPVAATPLMEAVTL